MGISRRTVRSVIAVTALVVSASPALATSSASASTFQPIAKGDIIASLANGQVNEYTPSGSLVQTLIPAASTPTGSAFDAAGNLYVTEFGANDILKVDASTGQVSVFSDNTILGDGTTFNSPESIAFGPGFKRMYVTDANRDGTGGGIHVIDPATGKGLGFYPLPGSSGSEGQGESDWLAFDKSGNLFMTNENPTQGIMEVNKTSGDIIQPSFVANLPDYGYAISFDDNGNLWLSDTSSILEYDSSGNLLNTITNPDFGTVFAAVFNPSYRTVYAGDLSNGNVYTYDLAGNLKQTFNTGSGINGLSVAGTDVAPATGYVAMGDSYSSGEGLSPYVQGSDTRRDHCHRSEEAYGPLLDKALSLGKLTFVACSGSVTQDFFTSNHADPTEPAQIKALNTNTGTVTFTIGGNDAGFASVLDKCIRLRPFRWDGYGCSADKKLVDAVNARIAALKGVGKATTPDNTTVIPIQDLLKRIHQLAPRAEIVVAGYPRLFGRSKSDYSSSDSAPSKLVCHVGSGGTVDYTDAQWLDKEAAALDASIASAVSSAQAAGLPVTYVSSVPKDFAAHGLCDSGTPWVNGLLLKGLGADPASFHPTATGQSDGYEVAFSGLPTF